MIHHFRFAVRHLLHRKLYTSVIIGSLALGFFCSGLLISYLIAEMQTDRFHPSAQRLYQIFSNDPFEGKGKLAYVPSYLSDYFDNFPEIESMGAMATINKASIKIEQSEFTDATVVLADEAMFDLFDFPITSGELHKTSFSSDVFISESKRAEWFGDRNALGEMITLTVGDTTRLLKVAGILGKADGNSHLQFDVLVHHSVLENAWNGGSYYARLTDENLAPVLMQKINSDPKRPGLLGPGSMNYFFEPIADSYFNVYNKMPHMRTQNKVFIWSGIVICAMILLMATFNFINLFLLSIQSRQKMTGIKKTMGISLGKLLEGSLAEIALYVSSAIVIAMTLMIIALPSFNEMLSTTLSIANLFKPQVLLIVAAAVFMIGVVAIILSSIHQWKTLPVSLMKSGSTKVAFSKSMFTIQFFISITLTICATIIIQQTRHLTEGDLGFNRKIVQLSSPDKELSALLPALKQEITQIAQVRHAALCNGHPVSGNTAIRYDLKDGTFYSPFLFTGDADYINALDLKILEGQPAALGSNGRLVNEAFVRYFNLKNPIGETVPGTEYVISGVVKDFTSVSFKEAIQPAIIGEDQNLQNIIIDYGGTDLATLVPKVKVAWQKVYPDHAFFYQVLETDLLHKYKTELFFYRAVVAFAVMSMLISCFGLFALSWAVVQSRTKEMGIRKLLGASVKDILRLLTTTFFKRITIAFILASPVAYFLMQRWLENFANKITISPLLFAMTAFFVFTIALITLSFQTMKAARVNPVEEIRE